MPVAPLQAHHDLRRLAAGTASFFSWRTCSLPEISHASDTIHKRDSLDSVGGVCGSVRADSVATAEVAFYPARTETLLDRSITDVYRDDGPGTTQYTHRNIASADGGRSTTFGTKFTPASNGAPSNQPSYGTEPIESFGSRPSVALERDSTSLQPDSRIRSLLERGKAFTSVRIDAANSRKDNTHTQQNFVSTMIHYLLRY